MSGDLLLVTTQTFVGKQIRKVTKSKYNHVAIFLNDDFIIESQNGIGVIITPFKYYIDAYKKKKLTFDIFRLKEPLKESEWQVIETFLLDTVGRKYDFLQFISLFIFFLFRINRHVEPFDIDKAFICSELVGKAFNMVNISFTDDIDLDNLTPKDIESSKIIEKVNYDNIY